MNGDPAIFLAGDASYNQRLLLEGKVDGVSSDPNVSRATLARIRALAEERPLIYLPSHDADSESRLSSLSVVNVSRTDVKT